jgi:hypothetical protein
MLVLVAVRQQGQEARALDGRIELTLEDGTGAGQTCRNDLAVFGNEVTQRVDVLVVDFFDTPVTVKRQKRLRLNSRTGCCASGACLC